MIKILKGKSVKELDLLHCEFSGQKSLELMENAADAFTKWLVSNFSDSEQRVRIFCGAGNNGGDGFAIARLLSDKGFTVEVVGCFSDGTKLSPNAQANFDRLPREVNFSFFQSNQLYSEFDLIIDAYLGVGLTGNLRKEAKEIIEVMNGCTGDKIAVDIPSGLPADSIAQSVTFQADFTLTFAFPKLSLLLPENALLTGELIVADIGISPELYEHFSDELYFLKSIDIPKLHRKFHRFSHKGDFGKILLIGGSPGKMGALHLSAKSALRTGAGLVTCFLDQSERMILQSSLPEAMCLWGEIPSLDKFDAIGIGPGWGVINRREVLKFILMNCTSPLVIDADAINLLAEYPELIELLPENTILTPHPGEFDRLLGKSSDHLERLQKARQFAMKRNILLILKGANSVISLPDGRQLINSTGTKYMATGGSGDVLTGMITAFLGMGYSAEYAAICGVYHHGLAGEFAGSKRKYGTIAGDLIEEIPATFIAMGIE